MLTFFAVILGLFSIAGVVFAAVMSSMSKAKLRELGTYDKESLGEREKQHHNKLNNEHKTKVRFASTIKTSSLVLLVLSITSGLVYNGVFYLEPGLNAHGRTIFGTEFAYTKQGWHFSGWGNYNPWDKYFSVVTTNEPGQTASVVKPAYRVRMLDQVDGLLSTTVRYKLPEDPDMFKTIARAYRTQANLLSVELTPPIKETMNATSSLMGAEEYYNGGRTQFAREFDSMMREGIYSLSRIEVIEKTLLPHKGSANAAKGIDQDGYGENVKVVFKVKKAEDENGIPIRKRHNFLDWGITVETAIVTDFDPNKEFDDRMMLKQQASADRAIAREQRVQEEEQKLLAEAKGAREVAEAQAEELKLQITATTRAQTEKQLAITKAERIQESALIAETTAETELRIAVLDAQKIRTLADAEAHAKEVVMKADGALAQKLATLEKMNKDAWAYASQQKWTPEISFGGGSGSGSMSEVDALIKTMLVNNAKALNIDMTIKQ